MSVEEQLQPTLDWLKQKIGLSDEKLEELVRRQELELNILWFQDRLQSDQKSLQRVVLRLTRIVGRSAQLRGSNMEEMLEPTLVWLQRKLLLDDAGLGKLVEKEASFLGLSLESHKERVACMASKEA